MNTLRTSLILALIILAASIQTVHAQRRPPRTLRYRAATEITPFFGWQFFGRMPVTDGDLLLKDSQNFGLDISIPVHYDVAVLLSYSRQSTVLQFKSYAPGEPRVTTDLFETDVDYWLFGGIKEVKYPNVILYGSMAAGAAVFSPQDPNYTKETLFAITGGFGGKYYLNKHLGLRLQGRILLPIRFGGGGMWCGPGGCSVGIGASSAILQFDATAGLVFRLNDPNSQKSKIKR